MVHSWYPPELCSTAVSISSSSSESSLSIRLQSRMLMSCVMGSVGCEKRLRLLLLAVPREVKI